MAGLLGNLAAGDEVTVESAPLFFYNRAYSKQQTKVNGDFRVVPVEYGEENKNNFISLKQQSVY
ncbi:MAG: hypothetical protein QM398_05415 [Thermoproteota archaeon]|nr:hypothetical protein [Thermoproteota archaeon]NLD64950.1 hypothetical protein [Thermoproteota archaeon]